MAQIKYNRTKGMKKVLSKSRLTESVAGEAYKKIYPKVMQEIQRKNNENTSISERAKNIYITGADKQNNLKPEIRDAIEQIKSAAASENIELQVASLDILKDVFPLCLESDEISGPVAQRLIKKGDGMVSLKLSNIAFNQRKLFDFIGDLLLFDPSQTKENIIALVVNVLRLVGKVLLATTIQLDPSDARIVLYVYDNTTSTLGIEETLLIDRLSNEYPDMSNIQQRINKLLEFRCLEAINGIITLAESI